MFNIFKNLISLNFFIKIGSLFFQKCRLFQNLKLLVFPNFFFLISIFLKFIIPIYPKLKNSLIFSKLKKFSGFLKFYFFQEFWFFENFEILLSILILFKNVNFFKNIDFSKKLILSVFPKSKIFGESKFFYFLVIFETSKFFTYLLMFSFNFEIFQSIKIVDIFQECLFHSWVLILSEMLIFIKFLNFSNFAKLKIFDISQNFWFYFKT